MGLTKRSGGIVVVGAVCVVAGIVIGGYLNFAASETGYGGASISRDDVVEINAALIERMDVMVETWPLEERTAYFDYVYAGEFNRDNSPVTPRQWERHYCYIMEEYPERLAGFEDRLNCGGMT